jgi:hypothetical protein
LQSWAQAPKVNVFPDRFVLLAYKERYGALNEELKIPGNPIPSPLIVGPDPSAPPEERLRQDDEGNLIFNDSLQWMVDFERAVEWGLGFKVKLSPEQAKEGFDRLLVVGLSLSASIPESTALLETLIEHHHYGTSGFSILPQGTPTNNTDDGGAGHSEDADTSYEHYFLKDGFTETDDWFLKQDGQCFADCLGVDSSVLKRVLHSDGTDQREARAMNVALWPATLGYMMNTMMWPVFNENVIENTYQFLKYLVSGRGMIPAVRIGNQPYGILPTTAFSRMAWFDNEFPPLENLGFQHSNDINTYLEKLCNVVKDISDHWDKHLDSLAFVSKSGESDQTDVKDAHQTLLNILGLHASSVEFDQRYSQSLDLVFNCFFYLYLIYLGFGEDPQSQAYLQSSFLGAATEWRNLGLTLLQQWGYENSNIPQILEQLFSAKENSLKGPIIDDRPLSETECIRSYTPGNDGKLDPEGDNYIEWLIKTIRSSKPLNALRLYHGLVKDEPPNALLFILLRHALMLEYLDVSLRLHQAKGINAARTEPEFIHIESKPGNGPKLDNSESRWRFLYKSEPAITNNGNEQVCDYISRSFETLPEAYILRNQLNALEQLEDAPTAHLERVFAEHIDCCSYRLDAWKSGLIHYQLLAMRSRISYDDQQDRSKGVYLGAYAWIEDVRPENKSLTPVNLEPELDGIFNTGTTSPLLKDKNNGGYIHTPSLNQAVTAAVLRNAYQSYATPEEPDLFAVNLSSERVRAAMSILEGIRGGQSLGALLGYQLERGLHDRHNLGAEVDQFIYKLRKAFPLRADHLNTTKTEEGIPIQAIEARNVVDGLKLINQIKKSKNKTYPFDSGKLVTLDQNSPPAPNSTQSAVINAEVDRLLNIYDAIADLALAESVHQVVQGNYDRTAATLETYSKGHYPPEPDVIQTPRSGVTLTHRVGVHLAPGLDSNLSPLAGIEVTPRIQAEPAVNAWLAGLLPFPIEVGCQVTWDDPVQGAQEIVVTQQDLHLQPIDLLYLVQSEEQPDISGLDDRILLYVITTFALRPDALVAIHHLEPVEGVVTFFELAPLLRSLRNLIFHSRPLKRSDVLLANDPESTEEDLAFVDENRITQVKGGLERLRTDVEDFYTLLNTRLSNLDHWREEVFDNIDADISNFSTLLATANLYGVPQTSWRFACEWQRRTFNDLLEKVQEVIDRWRAKLAQFDDLISDYDALPEAALEEERYILLQRAELVISTELSSPRPSTPEDLHRSLSSKRAAFVQRLSDFSSILGTSETTIAQVLADVKLLLPVSDFDLQEVDLGSIEQAILSFSEDLMDMAKSLADELQKRLATAQEQLDKHDNATQVGVRLEALQEAAKAMLGEDFQILPEFELTSSQGDEWEKALNLSQSGDLLRYLTQTLVPPIDFPLDDWLYGVARVREKMHSWEQLTLLTGAFGQAEPQLEPIQLPFKTDDLWLGMQFPDNYHLDGDRLLYTTHYAVGFQKKARQCGLLLDEWTEVIPIIQEKSGAEQVKLKSQETTGIAFNYDRPNNEPPQTWLLVTPPKFQGHWQWDDLVKAINETLDMAKKRAIEPGQLMGQKKEGEEAIPNAPEDYYAHFLPATLMAVNLYQVSISANLAENNNVYDQLPE